MPYGRLVLAKLQPPHNKVQNHYGFTISNCALVTDFICHMYQCNERIFFFLGGGGGVVVVLFLFIVCVYLGFLQFFRG